MERGGGVEAREGGKSEESKWEVWEVWEIERVEVKAQWQGKRAIV